METEAVPLVVIVAPPPVVAVSVPVPAVMETTVVIEAESSATDRALLLAVENTSAVSSRVVCAKGIEFTGGALGDSKAPMSMRGTTTRGKPGPRWSKGIGSVVSRSPSRS